MTTLTGVGTVSQIQVYFYGYDTDIGGELIVVELYNGSGYEGGIPTGFTSSWGWTSVTFSGLSMTQANLDACRVRVTAALPKGLTEIRISCIYAVVTYTEAGYSHEVNGVDPSEIDEVMGVTSADIDEVMGV